MRIVVDALSVLGSVQMISRPDYIFKKLTIACDITGEIITYRHRRFGA
jgi:hypothetical protein